MKALFSAAFLSVCLLSSGPGHAQAATARPPAQQEQSLKDLKKLMDKRLFKQAAEQALKQLNEHNDKGSGKDLLTYCRALQNLNALDDTTNLDTIMQQQMPLHGGNPHFLLAAAELYMHSCHTFKLIDGAYIRTARQWDGEYSGAARDKVEALRLIQRASTLAEQSKDMDTLGKARFMMARTFLQQNDENYYNNNVFQTYAALSNLTGLQELPGYVPRNEAHEYRNVETLPVTINPATGKPEVVFYHAPATWEAAKNDGERVRWLLNAAMQANPALNNAVNQFTASWCRQLFSYSNTESGQDFVYGPGNAGSAGGINPANLETNQTVVKTNRTERGDFMLITLPPNYDFIKIASAVTPEPSPGPYLAVNSMVAEEFLSRNQRTAAADRLTNTLQTWEKLPPEQEGITKEDKKAIPLVLKNRIAAILTANGEFDNDRRTLVAGTAVTVPFSYRNATRAVVTARPVNMKMWVESDINTVLTSLTLDKAYRKKYAGYSDLLFRLLNDKTYAYLLGAEVKGETITLAPGDAHLNQVAQLPVPTQQPGWYILTATLDNGYQFHRFVTLSDMVLIRRSIPTGNLWFLADAKTGAPVEGGQINMVRYGYEKKQLKRRHIEGTTNKEGVLLENIPARNEDNYSRFDYFLGMASKGNSYFIMGLSEWQSGNNRMDTANQANDTYGCYFIESQPVYRPGQTARFKGVVFQPNFATPGTKACAGKKLTLTITSPTGDKGVFPAQTVTTDETGCFELELLIPSGAPLGQYQAKLAFSNRHGEDRDMYAPLFRMEEYKKPEFEVKLDAPTKPLRLGQPIPVTVQSSYYAGGPVSEGKAVITITRTLGANVWMPYWRWNWLYDDSLNPYYFNFRQYSPLTVLEKTVPLDKDGKATVELSTEQDAKNFAAHDITYNVSVSVTDASLREVSASGTVIATCRPFNIFVTLSRGFALAGVPVQATITAATADGTKIGKADGKATLYRINAAPEQGGKPIKGKELASWNISTNEDGEASLTFQTTETGLYGLAVTMTNKEGNKVEQTHQFLSSGKETSAPFKINPLSITPDKKTYAPGETASLLVASDYADAHVWAFLRNGWKNESRRLVKLNGQTALVECPLSREDMPNMGVNAFTVHNGELFQASAEILLPPASQILTADVSSAKPQYQPGEKGSVSVLVKGPDGKPVSNGVVTLAVYDKALEYIARPNVTNIAKQTWSRLNTTGRLNLNNARLDEFIQDRKPDQPYFQSLLRAYWNGGDIGYGTGCGEGDTFCDAQPVDGRVGLKRMEARSAMLGPAPTAAPCMLAEAEAADSFAAAPMQHSEENKQTDLSQIKLRTNFADSIKWCGTLKTDADGRVTVPVDMPDNLTTWKATAWVITSALQVGQGSVDFLTTKDFMISMQTPRFFVEKDVVMLSAVVRNRTDKDVKAAISLSLKNDCLALLPSGDPALKGLTDETGNADIRKVTVPAKGQVTVNWWTTAVREGAATVAMDGYTMGDSDNGDNAKNTGLADGMQMTYPVLVHGMKQLHAGSAVLLPGEERQPLDINLPLQRRREESELIVKVSPSIALSMVEALPYLAEYPYGCVEQTLNRFLPAVVVTDALKQLGLNPGQALTAHRNLNPQTIKDKAFYDRVMQRLERNPVYDTAKIQAMTKDGIRQLREKQCPDGSWGWFGGSREGDPVMTAHVVHGLNQMVQTRTDSMLYRAVKWLTGEEQEQTRLLRKGDEYRKLEQLPDGKAKTEAIRKLGHYRLEASPSDVLIRSVLAGSGVKNLPMEDYLFRDRLTLPVLSQIQLAEILLDSHRQKDLDQIMPIITQFLQQDDSLQTAWLRLPNEGYWWRWYGSSVSTQAAFLKLMAKSRPDAPVTSRLAKWLLNNRANGSYWNSTKDTADCLEALSAYLCQTREGMEDMEAEILYDGAPVKTVSSTKETLFTFDNEFRMSGKALTDGKHTITIRRKQGKGNIYANSTLSYFSLEDPIPAAGNAVTVERSYYRINPTVVKNDAVKDTQTDTGELTTQGRNLTQRTLLKDGDIIASGDIIEVVMTVKTKNDVEYLMLRDPKPAGCESQETTSGYADMGTAFGYKEIGDEEIRAFFSKLTMGEYQINHRLRAERPGRFSALPAVMEAMYAPELRGNSKEHKVNISMPQTQQ